MALKNYYDTLYKLDTTEVQDETGGVILSYIETEFKGLINQANSSEIELGNKLNISVSHKLYCGTSVSLSYDDMVKKDSRTYRVVSEPKDTIGRGHHYKILLQRLEN